MAVYTDVSDEELVTFLERYDIGTLQSFKGIAEGVENSNFFLQTDQASYILTLYEKRVNPDDLPFFLGLMDHLAARGVDCPTPVHDRDGKALQTLANRPAAIISFLPGVSPRRILLAHCAPLGKALAEMHLASNDFPLQRQNTLGLNGWRPLFERCLDVPANKDTKQKQDIDNIFPGIVGLVTAELAYLDAHWPGDLPAGVIHADLFPDNVFYIGDRLSGLIDYYFACHDFYAYDLAICLNAWCFEPDVSFNISKARHMINAYRGVRPFSTAELNALPVLARGAALRFLLTRLYDWINHPPGALVTPKDPTEYVRKLRFHQQVTGPGDYGLDQIHG